MVKNTDNVKRNTKYEKIKAEPLKGKISYVQEDLYGEPKPRPLSKIEIEVFLKQDVKSAVEWLKKELILSHATPEINDWFQKKIDEAFEDVINK